MKNNSKKSNLIAIIVCAVLACSLLASVFTMGLGFMTDNFTNGDPTTWFERDLNEDNLLKRENYHENLIEETKGGLKLNWKDDGSVVLTGSQKADKDGEDYYRYEFASVTLTPGVYKLSCGNDKADAETFGLHYTYSQDGAVVQNYLGNEVDTITITEEMGETVIRLEIFALEGEQFFGIQSYVRPILVPETAEVEFYK